MQKTKICSKCEVELPMNNDYFHRDNGKMDGFRGECKVCRGFNYTKKLDVKDGYKKCFMCNS